MTIPTIHPNGTCKAGLIDDMESAYYALGKAYDALKRTAPNGRDYYPQGAHALAAAEREHLGRLLKIDEVRHELSALMVAIDRQ